MRGLLPSSAVYGVTTSENLGLYDGTDGAIPAPRKQPKKWMKYMSRPQGPIMPKHRGTRTRGRLCTLVHVLNGV